uniref:Activator of 90 kDa heat shock protein ATPase homolog 1-like n=1 Tax=Dermatophagoides pteronyssinus TaxID=6956 RepID=A0A6P6Y4I9_DERPT|nr:activator of 90 kDa heat shock protein ATPase homolog 1-like [Dermatophagoides pteronyssinus]
MAKWGEGDPRWIVEERPDATNVNNWHWTEKNASHWSKDKLKTLLENILIEENGLGQCRIKQIDSIDGEAVANNRKGKLIFFYEWIIKCTWIGILNGDSTEYSGKLEIPNLSEENSSDDITIDVSIDDPNSAQAEILKQLVRTKGLSIVQDRMKQYITALRNEFAKDMIKPTKLSESSGGNINSFQTEQQLEEKKKSESKTTASKTATVSKKPDQAGGDVPFETTSLKLIENFKCTAEEIYKTFTEEIFLQAFTRNKVKCDPVVGGRFSLMDGNIIGKFIQLEPNKLIRQFWRLKSWPQEHYSEVEIRIEQQSDSTQIILEQNGVPKLNLENTEEGWKKHYFESIKRTFGFGASFY